MQDLQRRWRDEDVLGRQPEWHGVVQIAVFQQFNVLDTLHVNVQQTSLALTSLHILQRRPARAVEISMHVGVLQEQPTRDGGLHVFGRHEMVMNAMDFTLAWLPCGVRHGEGELVVVVLHESLDDGALADTGGTADDERIQDEIGDLRRVVRLCGIGCLVAVVGFVIEGCAGVQPGSVRGEDIEPCLGHAMLWRSHAADAQHVACAQCESSNALAA
mmetsp:Transcript_16888/g.46677  ORF Transcript_16888/g.46677 Transcript_16888/m.46677 type:complete len:216 (-) Transcript_16888:260-907(-)